MKTIFDELQQEVKNWWISLILGILYVIVAISLMFSPLSGYAVLSILFSVSMLFSGLQIAEKDRLRFTILSSILLIACPVAIEWIFNKLTVVLN